MKKLVAFILALAFSVCLFGCKGSSAHKNDLFETEGIKHVSVAALVEDQKYSFTGPKAKSVVEYLASLKLTTNYKEGSQELYGYAWDITIEYESGEIVTWYHIANTILRAKTGAVYKMDHEEAHRFESLLAELSS